MIKNWMTWWGFSVGFGTYAFWAFVWGTPTQWLVARNLLTIVQWLQILMFFWLAMWLTKRRNMYDVKAQEAETAKAEAERAREQYARYCRNIAIQLESQRSRPMYEVRRAPIQGEVISPPPEPPELR